MNTHNAFKFISSLCKQTYIQPRVVESKMREHFESTAKYQNKLWTRNILERLTNLNVGTNEVQFYASKQVKQMNGNNVENKFKQIVYDNMKHKLNDALENEESSRKFMFQSSIELKKIVNLNTISGYEYKCYVDNMWNISWKFHKEKCHEKFEWLTKRQKRELEMIVQISNKTVKSVTNNCGGLEKIVQRNSQSKKTDINGELEMTVQNNNVSEVQHNIGGLEMTVQNQTKNNCDWASVIENVKYKDENIEQKEVDNKPINLGNNELERNVELILSKPPGYRVFKEVKWNDVDVGIEETFAKIRLDKLYEKDNKTSNNPETCVVNVSEQSANIINFKNIRATDMKSNKRVQLVESNNLELETKFKNLKIEFSKGYKYYNYEYKNQLYSNLTENERDGLKKVNNSVKSKESVVNQTDKSKKFTVDNPDSYKNDMKKYVENDKVIDSKHVNKVTKLFNDVTKFLASILKTGESHNQLNRVLKNLVVSPDGEIPVLGGMYKDHKSGRNFRPFVNGNVGPIANISNILSKILMWKT